MNPNADPNLNEGQNPYSPPSVTEDELTIASPFTWEYWATLLFLFVVSLPLIYLVPPLGVLMFFTVIFATVRSLLQVRSIRRNKIEAVANTIAISMAPFMMSSIGIGFLTTIASSIAFVSVCFPAGLALFSLAPAFSSTPELGTIGFIAICGLGAGAAIWVAIIILTKSIR
jgi:hypothetical protein